MPTIDSDDGYCNLEMVAKIRMIAMELATIASLFLGGQDLVSMMKESMMSLA
jgi:hypothetical protein